MKNLRLFLTIAFLFGFMIAKSQNPVGIFDNHADIGPVVHKGTSIFDESTQTYKLSGAGENIWFQKDELHFVWKKLKGDFLLTTQPRLEGEGVNPHRKSGWMVRTSIDASAAMVCLTVHGDGLTCFQYRKKNSTDIEEIKIPILNADILQLERRGRSYFVSVARLGNPFWTVEIPDFDFQEELLAGLFICSHNKNTVEQVSFGNTRVFTAISK